MTMTKAKRKTPTRQRRKFEDVKAEIAGIQAKRELHAKLQVVRHVRVSDKWSWRQRDELMKAVSDGHLRVVYTRSTCSYDPQQQWMYHAWTWSNPKSHSTYDGAHDFELYHRDKDTPSLSEPVLKYTIWDCENLRGDREEVRVTYILVGDWTKVPFLCERLEHKFKHYCLAEYDKELERQREAAAEALGANLLRAVANINDIVVDEFEPEMVEDAVDELQSEGEQE